MASRRVTLRSAMQFRCVESPGLSRSIDARFAAFLLACSAPQPTVPGEAVAGPAAFHDAVGYGVHAQGGRGVRIIQVTTLDDAGTGSLRACIDAAGPRVCVFRIARVISFTTERAIVRDPFLTIAGQTAPGGLVLTHGGGREGFTPLIIKNTHDVVVRNIRVRLARPGRTDRGRGAPGLS
jgi:pectate lyase